MSGKKDVNMLSGSLTRSIIIYTVPIIFTGVLQLLFNAADLIVVGRYCGSASVGAVGATGSVTNLIVNTFIGLSVGSGISAAHAIGAGNKEEVYRIVHTIIPVALIIGLFLTFIGVCFSESFLELMGTPESFLPLSALYMRIYFAGITATVVFNFGASILRAAGDTRSPLMYLTCGGILNVILNVIFVVKFNMDVAGVALATVIAQMLAAVLIILELMRRTDACRLHLKEMRIYKESLIKFIRIGVPAGLQSSLFSISNVMIQSSVNSLGEAAVAGNAAAGNLEGFIYISMNAFQQTAINFSGQNMGIGNYRRIKKIFKYCLIYVSAVGLIGSTLVYSFGRQLLSVYITDSEAAIELGLIRMLFICAPYFLCGIMDVSTGILRGIGYSLQPMLITVMGVCVFRIFWIYAVFNRIHTPQSLYISYPVSWVLTFAVEITAFYYIMNKKIRAQKNTA